MQEQKNTTETETTEEKNQREATTGECVGTRANETAALSPADGKSAESPPTLEEKLAEAERKAAESHDNFLRAKAEAENTRRRAQDDISKANKFAVERFARELLAVRDSLEAALAVESPSIESLKSGTELTLRQLTGAFEKSSIKEINPANEKFNPNFHQAISTLESDQEPNTVVSVLQKGYLLADRVLRPALVIVAKAKT